MLNNLIKLVVNEYSLIESRHSLVLDCECTFMGTEEIHTYFPYDLKIKYSANWLGTPYYVEAEYSKFRLASVSLISLPTTVNGEIGIALDTFNDHLWNVRSIKSKDPIQTIMENDRYRARCRVGNVWIETQAEFEDAPKPGGNSIKKRYLEPKWCVWTKISRSHEHWPELDEPNFLLEAA